MTLHAIPPKTVTGAIGQHRYTLTFDPHAKTDAERWRWHLQIHRRYDFWGVAVSEVRAKKAVEQRVNYVLGGGTVR